jgi:hypothetical protein
MKRGKHFAEKVFGQPDIACRTQEEVQRIARRVHRSIQIRPSAFDLVVGFVDAPGIRGRFEIGPTRLLLQEDPLIFMLSCELCWLLWISVLK